MKIIISSSKTMNLSSDLLDGILPIFQTKVLEIKSLLQTKTYEELKTMYKTSDKLTRMVYEFYHDDQYARQSIDTYSGFVFKELNLSSYSTSQIDYMNKHLTILSAMYGVLTPNTVIKPYRLDYLMKFDINLYDYWEKDVNEYYENHTIINLASNEFSKIIKKNMIHIIFKEKTDKGYQVKSTYAKKARGAFLNQMILNQITDISLLKDILIYDYKFNSALSDENHFVYTK